MLTLLNSLLGARTCPLFSPTAIPARHSFRSVEISATVTTLLFGVVLTRLFAPSLATAATPFWSSTPLALSFSRSTRTTPTSLPFSGLVFPVRRVVTPSLMSSTAASTPVQSFLGPLARIEKITALTSCTTPTAMERSPRSTSKRATSSTTVRLTSTTRLRRTSSDSACLTQPSLSRTSRLSTSMRLPTYPSPATHLQRPLLVTSARTQPTTLSRQTSLVCRSTTTLG